MGRITKYRQKHRQPTKDKTRRGGLYGEFNPNTIKPPHTLIHMNGTDEAAAATLALSQARASIEERPIVDGAEAVRPGPMCLQALVQSPFYQAHVRRAEQMRVQPAQ